MRRLLLSSACVLILSACQGGAAKTQAQVTAIAQSPLTAALVTEVANYSPGTQALAVKVNSGIAATATDQAMACGAVNELGALYSLAAGFGVTSAADNTAEQVAAAGAKVACSSTVTDAKGVVTVALNAASAMSSTLSAAGMPVAAIAAPTPAP